MKFGAPRSIAKCQDGKEEPVIQPQSSVRAPAVAVVSLRSAPAMGQSLAPPLDEEKWHFSITPYLFLPVSTTGTSTVAGHNSVTVGAFAASVSAPACDIAS